MSSLSCIRWGGAFALLGVVAGAFGAHFLRDRLSAELLQTYEVAVRYQIYHAFGLLIVGLLEESRSGRALGAAGICFLAGIVLFCGSLYALVFLGSKGLGMITPLGGLAWVVGWICLLAGFRSTSQSRPPAG